MGLGNRIKDWVFVTGKDEITKSLRRLCSVVRLTLAFLFVLSVFSLALGFGLDTFFS